MAQFPSKEIAERSYAFRTLGLGYANLGGLLMAGGLGYDSEEGRALAGAITALMTGTAYATSAEMSEEHGAFPGYLPNRADMLRVIRNHRRAAYGSRTRDGYERTCIDYAAWRSTPSGCPGDPRRWPRRRSSPGTGPWNCGTAARIPATPRSR